MRSHLDERKQDSPRLARWLLCLLIPEEGAEAILGDIEEGFSAGRSRSWYWRQVIGSIFSWFKPSGRTQSAVVASDNLAHDLRLAARKLSRRPAFSTVVVLTLALGIGANAAIFSVVDGVLLRPLPYTDPDALVVVRIELPGLGITNAAASGPEVVDFRNGTESFEALGTVWYRPAALTDDATDPEEIDMAFVSAELLPLLGVEAALGRHPLPEEDIEGGEAVIVLADHLWTRRYAADPDIVGTRVEMDGVPLTVVGVMPADFRLHLPPDVGMPNRVDAWVPFGGGYAEDPRTWRIQTVIGRLADGATLRQANFELDALAARLRAEYSPDYEGTGWGVRVEPLNSDNVAHVRPLLLLLLGAVGLVLLIVCANVANLYLARAAEAQREIAVRVALGATRGRLLRQLGTECLLITGLGAALGVLLARWSIVVLPLLAPAGLPRIDDVTLDLRVLAFVALIAAATAFAFAGISSLEIRRSAHAGALSGAARSIGTVGGAQLRNVLLVAELALSLMLLIGVGLMVRSFTELSRVDPGFDPQGAVTIKLSLVDSHYRYDDPQKIALFYKELATQVADLPGVSSAGVTTQLPMDGPLVVESYAYETAEGVTEWGAASAAYRTVTPGWLEAMGARLLIGRMFEWGDDLDGPNVVIVDDTLAEVAWPGANPIGQRLQVEVFVYGDWRHVWAEVVGVVDHLRHDPSRTGIEQVYIPHSQSPMRTTVLTVRTDSEIQTVAGEVGAIVRGLNGDQPTDAALPLGDYLEEAVAPQRFALTLLSIFSAIALTLAVVGTYGVISYNVSQRTREIGIRIAIGASPQKVVRSVVASGGRIALVGIAIGILGAAALTRFLSSLLYGVTPTDPATFAILAVMLGCATLAACYIPARRAARLDPTTALRAD